MSQVACNKFQIAMCKPIKLPEKCVTEEIEKDWKKNEAKEKEMKVKNTQKIERRSLN